MLSCPACGGSVSSAAEACPHCGHPMRAAQPSRGMRRKRVQPIAAPGKMWKAYSLLATLIAAAAVIVLVVAVAVERPDEEKTRLIVWGALAMVLALFIGLYAKIGRWWYHE